MPLWALTPRNKGTTRTGSSWPGEGKKKRDTWQWGCQMTLGAIAVQTNNMMRVWNDEL